MYLIELAEKWLANPFTTLGIGLVLIVVAIKVTDQSAASIFVLSIAALCLAISIFRLEWVAHQALLPRILITLCVSSLAGLGLYELYGWRPSQKSTALQPNSVSSSTTLQDGPELQVSLDCGFRQFPIVVPAGQLDYVMAINKNVNRQQSHNRQFEILDNRGNASSLEWPIPGRRGHNVTYLRCIVSNHGPTNLLELKLPLMVTHGKDDTPDLYDGVRFSILERGHSVSFAVINECAVHADIRLHMAGTARLEHQSSSREFKIISQAVKPGQSQSFGLAGTFQDPRISPTGVICE